MALWNSETVQVILDTNALLMPFEVGINIDIALRDLLGDVEVIVPGPLIGELKHLNNKYTKAAIALARKYKIIHTKHSGDSSVIELACDTGGYVLTNDMELNKKLRRISVPTIMLKSGTHLVMSERPCGSCH